MSGAQTRHQDDDGFRSTAQMSEKRIRPLRSTRRKTWQRARVGRSLAQ